MSNVKHVTLQDVVKEFNDAYEEHSKKRVSKSLYYCGITHDLKERNDGHKIDDDEIIHYITCTTADAAKRVEQALHEAGFNTGNGTGHVTDETKIVYMYKIRKGSVQ